MLLVVDKLFETGMLASETYDMLLQGHFACNLLIGISNTGQCNKLALKMP